MRAIPLGAPPRQCALAAAAGLLAACAFWPLTLWPLMPLSLVLFLRLLRDHGPATARNLGLVYGLAFAAGTLHWMFSIFGAFAVPLLAIMAAYFGLFAFLVALTRGQGVPARVALIGLFDAPPVAASLVEAGATVLVAPTMDRMEWTRAQHEHHALLFRLRAVENDRWLVRASSSGRSEVISPRGVPSREGLKVGAVGRVLLPFAHRDTWALGGRLAFLGPAAAAGTALFLAWRVLALLRARWPREASPR
jgi:apolipoprotein N-acyltransferase